ncbi:MarR family winged helix-turn-helix transcriptional regulator [Aestuariivirga sp. YIM B02566]|uniref:MarR family transcriptional regulator n=1 Tax=Taklimakanibacter albus TaxID=2800327 RepID=A0ACC5RDN8_9HYPH|nr:MarR family transcriptional regulator [Aestuariivirga sp. YIM B02566]MBK1870763.1 MarR family transcriptional regulator [Aestuariivirga sp. YIM B02566]
MKPEHASIGLLLIDTGRLLRKRFEQNVRGTGLTRAQWQVLKEIYLKEGLNQGALAELLEVEPITVGRLVDRLEQAGLIERRPHPTDRRAWSLYLLPAAHPLLETLKHIAGETRAELLQGMSDTEIDEAMRLFAKMKDNLIAIMSDTADERRVGNGRR